MQKIRGRLVRDFFVFFKKALFELKSDFHVPKKFALFASLKTLLKWWNILFILS